MKTIGCCSPFFKLFCRSPKREEGDERVNQQYTATSPGKRFGLDGLPPTAQLGRASPTPLNLDAHEPRHDNIDNALTSKKAHRRVGSVPEAQLYASEPRPASVRRANSHPMTQRLKKVRRFIGMSITNLRGAVESDSPIDVLRQQYLDYKFSAPLDLYQTINGLELLIIKKISEKDNELDPRTPLLTVFSTACKSVYCRHLQPADKWIIRDGKLKQFKKAVADFKNFMQSEADHQDAGRFKTFQSAIKDFASDLKSDPEWRDYYKELDKFLKAAKEFERDLRSKFELKGSRKLDKFVATIQEFENKFQPNPKWKSYYQKLDEFKDSVKDFETSVQSEREWKNSIKLENLMISVKNFEGELQFDSKWGDYSELRKFLAGVRNFEGELRSDPEWQDYKGSFQAIVRDFAHDMQADPEWKHYRKLEKFRMDVENFEKDLEWDPDWKGYKDQYNQYLVTLEKCMLEVRTTQAQQSGPLRAPVNDRASALSIKGRIAQQRVQPSSSRITLTDDDRADAEELKQYLLTRPLGPEMIQLIRSVNG